MIPCEALLFHIYFAAHTNLVAGGVGAERLDKLGL